MCRHSLLLVLAMVVLADYGSTWVSAQNVVLSVDRDSGVVSFTNSDPTAGNVALYEISSELGSIDANSWVPLSDSDSSWRVLGTPTSNLLTEIKETGSLQISQASPAPLGAAFDPAPAKLAAGFAVDVEDLQVQLYDPQLDQLTSPTVVYMGEKIYNSLIVNVDALTGQANIENESPFDVELNGYTIGSVLGELNPLWAGIRASDPANWQQAGLDSTQFASELNRNPITAALTLTAGSTINLGMLYTGDGTNQDLTFDFILQGFEEPLSSVVKYTNVEFGGDADGDGDVDGADFLRLQRIAPHQIATWANSYGGGSLVGAATIGVPEPTAVVLAVVGLLLSIEQGSLRRTSGEYLNHGIER